MKTLLLIILMISLLYLTYLYWLKYNIQSKPILKKKIIKKIKKKSSSNNFNLTENALNQLDNVFDEYMQSKRRQKVFFDISNNNEIIGRITFELFDDIVPYTVKNFVFMVQNHYKNSTFHRIIKDFVIQGGDYINGDGSGTNSIYGKTFDDENFNLKHDKKYLLSMANSGPNTNGCQFFITLNQLEHLDNKHVVFGKVADDESKEIIDIMANTLVNQNDKPIVDYIIAECGII